MRNRGYVFLLSLSALMSSSALFAMQIDEEHPVKSTITVSQKATPQSMATTTKRDVYLMNITLSAREKKRLSQPAISKKDSKQGNELPLKNGFDMAGMPVLDQGNHGSCVTFAVTGALDALINKSDEVSQLCNLELGRYLKLRGYMLSGWNGTYGPVVIDQIIRFGYVPKQTQLTESCAGETEYVLNDEEEIGAPMRLEEFKAKSQDISKVIFPIKLLSVQERFMGDDIQSYDPTTFLYRVKKALNQTAQTKSLVVVGILLPDSTNGPGPQASFHVDHDTWALTADIDPEQIVGGHEMIVTAYDDNAVAYDQSGKAHKGLLTLRNSWSDKNGDHGDYYMTYDFFTQFVMEANQLVAFDNDINNR
jgi:hypothetical protein